MPLVGLADVTVIGRTGDASALAGVALGTTVITFIFWAFGFLRMGVTGITAQAQGSGDKQEVVATLLRALLIGGVTGLLLLTLSPFISPFALKIMATPDAARLDAASFMQARYFGAPAALGFYALNGWLLGLARTREVLLCQIVLNGTNIFLNILLVVGFGLGAMGIGIGTAIAEWCVLLFALAIARSIIRRTPYPGRITSSILWSWPALRQLISINADIMIRTLALLFLLSWFARSGARLGTVPLAANHLLMQFISVTAFVLDGFAFTAESRVAMAIGARSHQAFLRTIRLTVEFCTIGAILFALLILLSGGTAIDLMTLDEAVRVQARAMLPFCALVPLIGMPGWVLDGIFIGATRGTALRNAAVVATLAYLATDYALRGWGVSGVWIALIASYAYRALSLGFYMPSLSRSIEQLSSAK